MPQGDGWKDTSIHIHIYNTYIEAPSEWNSGGIPQTRGIKTIFILLTTNLLKDYENGKGNEVCGSGSGSSG
ncbi:MAG: hypothetical protein MR319_08535, partial [Mediterranea sp.]|nr:hypothetical protein [Mediterranea sp.]